MIGKKVLLIDDDPESHQLINILFKKAGMEVITAYNGMEGISKAYSYQPDLIILDVMLPDLKGFDVCQKIRRFSLAPIIIVSALKQERDMLQGLEAGADWYLSKPFNWEILLARSRAVIRRNRQKNVQETDFDYYDDGYLKIDTNKRRVYVNEKKVQLSSIEFRLLVYLATNADRVLSFAEILINVWGSQYKNTNDYVHVYVSHLRSKIEEDKKKPRYIQSIYGVGYLFEKQELLVAPSDKHDGAPFSVSEDINNFQY